MTDFSKISTHYEKTAVVQKSASDELLGLLEISETEDVLDLGCGPGHLTKRIAKATKGRVVGIDSAEGMIEKAREMYGQNNIDFDVCSAEHIAFKEEFDIIFCNSAFQWFNPPQPILKNCFQTLRKNGRVGIQAPAKRTYSPNFIQAVEYVRNDVRTKDIFSYFNSPWFFLETPDEYKSLFEASGFNVVHSHIDEVVSFHDPEAAFNIFDSGASAGYLNPKCYSTSLTNEYINDFRHIVKDAFEKQSNDQGKVKLIFYRISLVSQRCQIYYS